MKKPLTKKPITREVLVLVDHNGEMVKSTTTPSRMCVYETEQRALDEWGGDGFLENGQIGLRKATLTIEGK